MQYSHNQPHPIEAIEKAVKKADSKRAKFIEHKKVAEWLNSWGTEKEQEPPT